MLNSILVPSRRGRRALLIALCLFMLLLTSLVLAQDEAQPTSVVIAGTLQSALGCDDDWQPTCEATALAYDPDDDLWQATFELPAGDYEYKAILNGDEAQTVGANAGPDGESITLSLAEDSRVKFIYSHATGWVTDSVNSLIASVPGSYQELIGCPGEWAPDCLRALLQDPDGDGTYTFATSDLPGGFYEAKVAVNESWSLNYGLDGARDGANIGFTVNADGDEVVFSFDSSTNVMTISVGGQTGPAAGNLFLAKAHWVSADTILWDVDRIPGATYRLHFSPDGGLEIGPDGVVGGDALKISYDRSGMADEILARFPHLEDYSAFKIAPEDLERVPDILRGQIALSSRYNRDTVLLDATGLQIPGVIDDLYSYDDALGVTFADGVPSLRLWAPTAHSVSLHLFADSDPETESVVVPMEYESETGVWSAEGEADWYGQFYLYEVEVYAPGTQAVERNLVTDPYSFSLAMNSARSQIIDLNDPALMPEGWRELAKPPLAAPEDIALYELHVRDFSIRDESVPEELRGTFLAFAQQDSNGMAHLRALAEAGLTHIHLLPSFDFATTNENAAERQEPDFDELASFAPDSPEQQAITEALAELDGFNWGYDPYHYTVPEGSYSTDPDGAQRILEFRQMVQSLNQNGLRVVMDVVYNHTNAAGQAERSVLDRIVPGYYHRLNADGFVETSTCCPNTASEHTMMEKLMIDSLRTWATAYRVDGFRFDLMGHHMVDNMEAVRAALDGLTLEQDGVDGASIYIYGEGWDFGEVANEARGVNATQLNLPGTGIGTFNDRIRDAARGGNPFGGRQEQGFITGLYTDPNEVETRTPEEQLEVLLDFSDQIRVGLAGNLAEFTFENAGGELITGAEVDYNGQPAGYTLDPQEHIVYISAHDNETIFDAIQYKAPLHASTAERVRMLNMGMSLVALSQGVPFFHAGDDLLSSKSLDRDSYNSGDWFNAIDFTYQTNNWGIGLPPASKNEENWPMIQPLLANPGLMPTSEDIQNAAAHFQEMLAIRRSSPLFRLQTAEDVISRLTFANTGPDQTPGVIVMLLSDLVGEDLDPQYGMIVVVFNATPDPLTLEQADLTGMPLTLHPLQVESNDPIVRTASFDVETGSFSVPARTTAVFVAADGAMDE